MEHYYVKQQLFSWRDRFFVKDQQGRDIYIVEGQLFSWGKKLTIYDMAGRDVLYIEQKLLTWLPAYSLFVQGKEIAVIRKELSFLKPHYRIEGPDWEVKGSFWQHDYQMIDQGRVIADVQKEWFTWGDSYALRVEDEDAGLLALGVMIVIDCVMAAEASSNS